MALEEEKGQHKEWMKWWTMDAANELSLQVTIFVHSRDNFHPEKIKTISTIYVADHGKEKHRFGCKTVVTMKKKDIGISLYPLADILCTNNNTGEVFKHTMKSNLAKGIAGCITARSSLR